MAVFLYLLFKQMIVTLNCLIDTISNREKELLKTLTELKNKLDVSGIYTKQIILGGDFNFCFDFMLETKGGNPA